MFESSLIDLGNRRRPARRWLSLPAAVVIHLLAFGSIAFAQYWQIDRVSEPEMNVVFLEQPPLPAAPAARAPEPAPRRAAATPPAPAPLAPPIQEPIQPDRVPDEIPPIPAAPEPVVPGFGENTSTGGSTSGVDGMQGLGGGGTGDGHGTGGDGSGPGDGGDIVYRPGNGVSRPEILYRVEPRYTETARKSRLQGTVIVEATIDETGRVQDIHVLKGLPLGLDRAAVEAVSQWRFKPAVYQGRPVKVLYSLTVNFLVH